MNAHAAAYAHAQLAPRQCRAAVPMESPVGVDDDVQSPRFRVPARVTSVRLDRAYARNATTPAVEVASRDVDWIGEAAHGTLLQLLMMTYVSK